MNPSHFHIIPPCLWVLGSRVNVNCRALFHKAAHEHLPICSSSQAPALLGGVGTSWSRLPAFSFITLQSWCSTETTQSNGKSHLEILHVNMTCSPAPHYYSVCQTIYTPAGSWKNTPLQNAHWQKPEYTSEHANTQSGWTHNNGIRRTKARCISSWFNTKENTQRQWMTIFNKQRI